MHLNLYKIDGTINLDSHSCFENGGTYPNFQTNLNEFKLHLKELVNKKKSKTFYKFGDGDYHFLKKNEIGSAKPGNRALTKSYNDDTYISTCNSLG